MDTIPVRPADTAALRTPSEAPVVRVAHDRVVLVAALLLVVGNLVLRGWLFGQRHYYADDLRLLHLADGSALLSPSYLLQDYDGHLMPGAFLVAGLVERAGPLEWWPAAVSLLLLQALASLALLRLLRVVLGERPVLLVALAFGLFTPMVLGSVTWWAAALNSLPLQIGLAWFVADAVLLVRTGRRRYAVSGTAALAFALAFYLKAVLLPPVAFGVVVVLLLRDGTPSPLLAAVRRGRELWWGTGAVLAVWAVTYLATRTDDPVDVGSAGQVGLTVATGFKALTPAVLGGPFRWEIRPPRRPPLSEPPDLDAGGRGDGAAGGGRLDLRPPARRLAGVGPGRRHRRRRAAARGAGSLGPGAGGSVVPLAHRYFAADAVLLPLAGALLVSLPLRPRFHRRYGRPAWSARPWAAAGTALLTACFVAGGVQSAVGHARAWEADRTGEFLDTARASLAAAGPAPLLDQVLPFAVVVGMSPPVDRLSGVLGPLEDRPPFAAATSELRLLDAAGHPGAGPRRARRPDPDRAGPCLRLRGGRVATHGDPPPGRRAARRGLDGAARLHLRRRRRARGGAGRRRAGGGAGRRRHLRRLRPAGRARVGAAGGQRDRRARGVHLRRRGRPPRHMRVRGPAGTAAARRASRCAGTS